MIPVDLSPSIILQPPLSGHRHHPGLILIRPSQYSEYQQHNHILDPEPLHKWAEESFEVVQVTFHADQSVVTFENVIRLAKQGLEILRESNGFSHFGFIGLFGHKALTMAAMLIIILVYGSPADYSSGFKASLQQTLATDNKVDGRYLPCELEPKVLQGGPGTYSRI